MGRCCILLLGGAWNNRIMTENRNNIFRKKLDGGSGFTVPYIARECFLLGWTFDHHPWRNAQKTFDNNFSLEIIQTCIETFCTIQHTFISKSKDLSRLQNIVLKEILKFKNYFYLYDHYIRFLLNIFSLAADIYIMKG